MRTHTINRASLISLIADLASRGTVAAQLHTLTDPAMNKGRGENRNPFLGAVKKVTAINVMFGADYENGVNRRLAKAGKASDFASATTWYKRFNGLSTVVVHKAKGEAGGLYFRALVNRQNKPTVAYQTLDGEAFDGSLLSPWVSKSAPSKRQSEAGIAEEEQVMPRVWKLESITALTVGGETWIVRE